MTLSKLTALTTVLFALFAFSALAHPAADTAPIDTALLGTALIDTAPVAHAQPEIIQEAVQQTVDLEIEQALGLSHLELEFASGGFSYPACYLVHGTPCQPGTYARCQWNPYEPELCSCTNGTFQCGNLP